MILRKRKNIEEIKAHFHFKLASAFALKAQAHPHTHTLKYYSLNDLLNK